MPWWSGDLCETSFEQSVGSERLLATLWAPGGGHAVAVLIVITGWFLQCSRARRRGTAPLLSDYDDELDRLEASLLPEGQCSRPASVCRAATCGACCPERAAGETCDITWLAGYDRAEGVCRCLCVPMDCRGCCSRKERPLAAAGLFCASVMRIMWSFQRSGLLIPPSLPSLAVDVLLLRLPQCLWSWAFILMAVVWQDIAAASAGGAVSAGFRWAMNGLGAGLLVVELALTLAASLLLNSDEATALLLYNIGDFALAFVIVGLTLAGGRAVWRVLGILRGYSSHDLHGSEPGGGCCGCCCGGGVCRTLCTPVVARDDEADGEAGTFAAVYEALRQATVAMVVTGVLAVALVADVATKTGLRLSTEETPDRYIWFMAVFLSIEAMGAVLLGLMTWPRAAAKQAALNPE